MPNVVFTATIALGSDAMKTPEDVAGALRKIADKLDSYDGYDMFQTILDDNLNDVGRWKLGPLRSSPSRL